MLCLCHQHKMTCAALHRHAHPCVVHDGTAAGVLYQARAKVLIVKNSAPGAPRRARLPGTVAIASAGPADLPAAELAKLAAEHFGCYAFLVQLGAPLAPAANELEGPSDRGRVLRALSRRIMHH